MIEVLRRRMPVVLQEWDAFRDSSFGYSTMQIANATHLRWKQVQVLNACTCMQRSGRMRRPCGRRIPSTQMQKP